MWIEYIDIYAHRNIDSNTINGWIDGTTNAALVLVVLRRRYAHSEIKHDRFEEYSSRFQNVPEPS
jgi:hypothetical protein